MRSQHMHILVLRDGVCIYARKHRTRNRYSALLEAIAEFFPSKQTFVLFQETSAWDFGTSWRLFMGEILLSLFNTPNPVLSGQPTDRRDQFRRHGNFRCAGRAGLIEPLISRFTVAPTSSEALSEPFLRILVPAGLDAMNKTGPPKKSLPPRSSSPRGRKSITLRFPLAAF